MEHGNPDHPISPNALESLQIPQAFSLGVHQTAVELDHLLAKDTASADAIHARVAEHREATQSHLFTLKAGAVFHPDRFAWPSFLFIPKGANSRDYWPFANAPDDHRYAIDWTVPRSATNNHASRDDGTLFSFAQLHNETVRLTQSSSSAVGVFYTPLMTLGTVDLQASVACAGTWRTQLEFFSQLAAGFVEVTADLVLAAWQVIPGGFDLIGFKSFLVAGSGHRDQSHGPELKPFQRTFDGSNLSARFVVERGRRYLFAVMDRITVTSTLINTSGGSLPGVGDPRLLVWGSMNSVVSEIDVLTNRVDIP
jgi:hypothetical protein